MSGGQLLHAPASGFSLNCVFEAEDDDSEFESEQKDEDVNGVVSTPTQDWEVNVLVKFNVNPASQLKFNNDAESERTVVASTLGKLDQLLGLPVLAVGGTDVSTWNSSKLEDMLDQVTLPVLLRFGTVSLEMETITVTLSSNSSLNSIAEPVKYLGKTESVAYDDESKEESSFENELSLVRENTEEDYTLQPISFQGTQGDQSTWSVECKERAKIITELLNTEKSYITGLEELNKEFLLPFLNPLKKSCKVDVSPFQATIATLIKLHGDIYEKFCNAENICNVFQEEFHCLKMYKPWIKIYEETCKKLLKVANKSSFKKIFKKSRSVSSGPIKYFQMRGITLVQRPPRYILLLKQLKKKTPPEHWMYSDLEKGLKDVQDTCGDINEYQRQVENKLKLFELSMEIDLRSLANHGVPKLVIAARRLIRVGDVAIKTIKPRRSLIRRTVEENPAIYELAVVVMCNDILMVLHGKKNRVIKVIAIKETVAKVIRDPIKPPNKNYKFEEVFELVLQKLDAEELERRMSERMQERLSLKTKGIVESRKFVSLSQLDLSGTETEDIFCIYLASLNEAEQWQKSISKYSSADYVN